MTMISILHARSLECIMARWQGRSINLNEHDQSNKSNTQRILIWPPKCRHPLWGQLKIYTWQ